MIFQVGTAIERSGTTESHRYTRRVQQEIGYERRHAL
jgi:hypothetical protein